MVLGCMDERSGITNWVLFLLYLSRYRNGQEASQVYHLVPTDASGQETILVRHYFH